VAAEFVINKTRYLHLFLMQVFRPDGAEEKREPWDQNWESWSGLVWSGLVWSGLVWSGLVPTSVYMKITEGDTSLCTLNSNPTSTTLQFTEVASFTMCISIRLHVNY
jgi:hypothetical protein